MMFNPPYVETNDDEMEHALKNSDVTAAWAGGEHGLVVINQFMDWIPKLLSKPNGVLYLLLIDVNRISKTIENILKKSDYKLKAESIMKREVLGEREIIIKFSWIEEFSS